VLTCRNGADAAFGIDEGVKTNGTILIRARGFKPMNVRGQQGSHFYPHHKLMTPVFLAYENIERCEKSKCPREYKDKWNKVLDATAINTRIACLAKCKSAIVKLANVMIQDILADVPRIKEKVAKAETNEQKKMLRSLARHSEKQLRRLQKIDMANITAADIRYIIMGA